MRIEIAKRLKPFTHQIGVPIMLPKSPCMVKVFPTRLVIENLNDGTSKMIDFSHKGPVDGFTVEQNLERGYVKFFGTALDGYFCHYIDAEGHLLESKPHGGSMVLERLSLGSHKAQEWELIRRRLDFTEIFPLWYRLGQLLPFQTINSPETVALLEDCRLAIAANAPEHILKNFRRLFLAGFTGGLVPRSHDDDYQGIIKNSDKEILSTPLILLKDGALLIRSLFIQETSGHINILPAIPPEFHCGRFLNIACGNDGHLDLEWTKKSVRCMTFQASEEQVLSFNFSGRHKSCRLRCSNIDRGSTYHLGSALEIAPNENYWFDNFK